MQTQVTLNKAEIEKIVEDHLQNKMQLYVNDSKSSETVWSSDGKMQMTVTFNEEQSD